MRVEGAVPVIERHERGSDGGGEHSRGQDLRRLPPGDLPERAHPRQRQEWWEIAEIARVVPEGRGRECGVEKREQQQGQDENTCRLLSEEDRHRCDGGDGEEQKYGNAQPGRCDPCAGALDPQPERDGRGVGEEQLPSTEVADR